MSYNQYVHEAFTAVCTLHAQDPQQALGLYQALAEGPAHHIRPTQGRMIGSIAPRIRRYTLCEQLAEASSLHRWQYWDSRLAQQDPEPVSQATRHGTPASSNVLTVMALPLRAARDNAVLPPTDSRWSITHLGSIIVNGQHTAAGLTWRFEAARQLPVPSRQLLHASAAQRIISSL